MFVLPFLQFSSSFPESVFHLLRHHLQGFILLKVDFPPIAECRFVHSLFQIDVNSELNGIQLYVIVKCTSEDTLSGGIPDCGIYIMN